MAGQAELVGYGLVWSISALQLLRWSRIKPTRDQQLEKPRFQTHFSI
jgi:hypothetical protein